MAKRHVNRAGDLQSLFLRLEELVLANSGEDEFEEVFKLIVAKLWDERLRAKLFHPHETNAQTASAIAELLRQASKGWPGVLNEPRMRLTNEHLAVCVEALTSHSLTNEGLEVLDSFFEFIVSKVQKGSKGQYFTPRHVVEFCVRMMDPKPHETVLDPACGSGGFLLHAFNHVRSKIRNTEVAAYCESKLWGFDMDERALRVGKALMVLAGGERTNFVRLNSLLKPTASDLFQDESILTIEDVGRSRLRRHKGFDVILTNPPFAGEVREKHLLNAYEVSAGSSRIERDLLFIERCVQLLRPGGRMAIVLPHNKFATESFGSIREWLLTKTRVLGVVGLGRNTFLPHTHQKASVLFLRKNDAKEDTSNSYDIFFSISEKDGKDSKGRVQVSNPKGATLWDQADHDLAEVHRDFQDFCHSKGLAI